MKTQIKGTNMELTEPIKGYVQQKIDMLDKYLGNLTVQIADIEVGVENNHHQHGDIFFCEINMAVPGDLLRVRKVEEDLYKAIDKAKDHMKEMIIKHKDKHNI
ncbi:ribosome-associated translation inhibitor RaiA [Candidatus Falkowbacteria bacterium]|nr:ribosome-associated translation inhibitor RaiA [Candidatus Falkowbacteria bacterium]